MKRAAIVAGGVIVLALLLTGPVAIVLVTRSGDDKPARQRITRVRVAEVPTDVVATGGQLWVSSARERRLVSVYDTDPPTIAGSAPLSTPPLRPPAHPTAAW